MVIHTKTKRESIRVDDFFNKNDIPEIEDYFVDIPYELKVNTPYGYHTVPQVCRTVKQKSIRLYFNNNKTLECGWDHKLKANGEWKSVKDIDITCDIIETETGVTKIKEIKEKTDKILYDLSVDKVHCFYSNGILSHNTWVLNAIGAQAVKAGKTVVHYTLELSEKYVGARYDTIFTGIPSSDLKEKSDVVYEKIKKLKGKLLIKYFPPKGITSKKLEAHIEKMIALGNKPDLIIVDYADLLLSHTNKSDSTYGEQGGIYIELRGMGGELGIPIWTASQANRCLALDSVVDTPSGKIQIGKIKEGDVVLTSDGYKPVTNVFPIGTQAVYRITLKSGKTIDVSAKHQFPTKYGNLKSIEMGLKVGDKLFTKKSEKNT
jgi:hypothetical protein